ncbi:MAG: hypothetical protein JO048_14500 [Methylobacteriaceae bacterium]|nr:hypothetical protein [Methylobacteriaceae bacterium]
MANEHRGTGKSELQDKAEKALALKKQAGPGAQIPEHRTPHEGGVRAPQVGATDTALGLEPTQTPNLKRSHNARSGDGR